MSYACPGSAPYSSGVMQNFAPYSNQAFAEVSCSVDAPKSNMRTLNSSPTLPRLNLPLQQPNFPLVGISGEFGDQASLDQSITRMTNFSAPVSRLNFPQPQQNFPAMGCSFEDISGENHRFPTQVLEYADPLNSNPHGISEIPYNPEGPVCNGRALDFSSVTPLSSSIQTLQQFPTTNISTRFDNNANVCQDIVGGVIKGLKLEERHQDVMDALNMIVERLESLEGISRHHSANDVNNNTDAEGCKFPNIRESSLTESVVQSCSNQYETYGLRYSSEGFVGGPNYQIMDSTKTNGNRLENIVRQVSESLDRFSHDYQTDTNAMREILRNEVSLDEIATAVHDKIGKDLTVSLDGSEVMRSLRQMQEKITDTDRDRDAKLLQSLRKVEDQVSDISREKGMHATISAHYSDMSRLLHKILQGQPDQETIAGCVNKQMGVMISDFSEMVAQVVEAFKWIKENHDSMLKAVKIIESSALQWASSSVQTSGRRSSLSSSQKQVTFDFTEEAVQRVMEGEQTTCRPYAQSPDTSRRFRNSPNGTSSSDMVMRSASQSPQNARNSNANRAIVMLPCEEWQPVFERLCERFPNLSSDKVIRALTENEGHAGKAASMLRQI